MTLKKSVFIGFLVLLGIAFNNFSKHDEKISPTRLAHATQDFQQKSKILQQEIHGKIAKDFCFQSNNYSCLKKHFSTSGLKNLESPSTCVRLLQGGEICPEEKTIHFDSRAAEKACGPHCEENYNYTEYSCHLKIPQGTEKLYPLISTETTIEQSIEKLAAACLQIAGEKTP